MITGPAFQEHLGQRSMQLEGTLWGLCSTAEATDQWLPPSPLWHQLGFGASVHVNVQLALLEADVRWSAA